MTRVMPSTTLSLLVSAFEPLTPRTRLLRLDAADTPFAFHAGQAVWMGRPWLTLRKPYSVASAPIDLAHAGVLEFLVRLEDDGRPGPHLGAIAPGDAVDIEGPLGGFDLPSSVPHAPVLLVAGGTGIAPLRSMWRELLGRADPPAVSVVYSARQPGEFAFLDELTALQSADRVRVTVTVTGGLQLAGGATGRITGAMLAAQVGAAEAVRCAVCGPAAFVAHVGHLLSRLGVPPVHIATERW